MAPYVTQRFRTITRSLHHAWEGVTTGEAYSQRYISVIRLRDGSIVHYKDYWNPIALLRAVKGSETTKGLTTD